MMLEAIAIAALAAVGFCRRRGMEHRVLQQKLQVREESYRQLQQYLQESRRIQHDMKHRLVVAEQLLNRGDLRAGERYIRTFLEELDGIGAFPVGDCAWETVLEIKRKKAAKKEIRVQIDTGALALGRIEELDVCVLLGNLLDNAIEAEELLKDGRQIRLHMREEFGIVFITIRNRIAESVLQKNRLLQSTKRNRGMHGFGIASVRGIVRKYNGTLKMNEENGWFQVEIWLQGNAR